MADSVCDWGILVAVREETSAVAQRLRGRRRCCDTTFDTCRGILAGSSVAVVRSGIGADRARKAAAELIERDAPRAVLVMGFCGGISEWAGAGDLVVAEYVMDWPDFPGVSDLDKPRQSMAPPPQLLAAAAAIELPGVHITVGGVVSVGALVRTTAMKGFHGPRAARCRALDMESAAAVSVADDHNTPWLVVRGVSDTIDEDLPMDFGEMTNAEGEVSRGRALLAAVKSPATAGALVRLGRQSLRAARNMAAFAEALVAAT